MIGPITGILASRNHIVSEFFTSVLYPFVVDESLAVNTTIRPGGYIWEMPLDSTGISVPNIVAGSLTETIIYRSYNEPLAAENLAIAMPSIIAGTLNETIIYRTYNEPLATEQIGISVPSITAGSLVESIVYVNYVNGEIESIAIGNPTIISGTLT